MNFPYTQKETVVITTFIVLALFAYIRERIREKYARIKEHNTQNYIVGNAS